MELYQNTLIKLIVRQGSDSERKHILLEKGEPAYTTDTERLYVGNGSLSGGNIAGNLFRGSASYPNDPSLTPAVEGDFAYGTVAKCLYRLDQNDGTLLTDWKQVAVGELVEGDNYIKVTGVGTLSLNPLSANMIDGDALSSSGGLSISSGRIKINTSSPLEIDGNTLTATMSAFYNSIYPVGSIYLSTTSTNPGTYFTHTTWVQKSQGRFLAGVGTGVDANLSSLNYSQGNDSTGEYYHKLTESELPAHDHAMKYAESDCSGGNYVTGGSTESAPAFPSSPMADAGGDQAHLNVPPAFGVYVWERTA